VNTGSDLKPNTFGGLIGTGVHLRFGMISTGRIGGAGQQHGGLILFLQENQMPARRLSMRKINEVLRLRFELGFGYRQIARSCLIGVGTVHEYLKRAEAAGLKWPLPDGMTENKLDELLFGRREAAAPDFAALHEQLRTHAHLTLQLLWEEYRQAQPDGYGYSRFCELYHHYRRKLDVVLRQDHVAG
jgi:hypothetical protein